MRVSFSQTYEKMTVNINRKQTDIDRLAAMISSGKRLQFPHDDPQSWAQALDLKQGLREFETFRKNMDYASDWNRATENALNQFLELLDRAKEVAIAAVGIDFEGRQEAHVQVLEQISQEALDLANTRHQDRYIFGGSNTSTQPFNPTDLSYQGNTEAIAVRVGKGLHQEINLDGQTVFFTDPNDPNSNILNLIGDLKDAVSLGDRAQIQNLEAAIDAAHEYVISKRSVVGARLESLERRQQILADLKLDQQSRLAGIEDADMVDTITQLQQKKTAFEAALSVTSMLDDLHLTRYL